MNSGIDQIQKENSSETESSTQRSAAQQFVHSRGAKVEEDELFLETIGTIAQQLLD